MNKEIVYLDLFSGIGGFTSGILQAGATFKKHYFSEIDKYAIATYKHNFPHGEHIGSVESIRGRGIERPNIITFGFPCQDLSIAGKREGIEGERSGLFFEAMRIIRDVKPDVFVFENVEGLLSSDEGKDFELVLREIADIGIYECEWQLIDTTCFLPQHRERVFFVGHNATERRSCFKVFPIRTDIKTTKNSMKIIGSVDETGHNSIWARVYDPTGIACTLNAKGGGMGAKTGLYRVKDGIRKLTPTECERLQGFPDNFTKHGVFNGSIEENSDSQRYKMLGNSVSVPIVKEIFERIFAHQ